MDELSIWTLRGDTVEAVESVSRQDLPENRLEETLVRRPDMLEPNIQLVGRQTPTEGGPLDLLGVDATGQLVVFELKRDKPTRDAVAQCIDYASALDAMDPGKDLPNLIQEHSGKQGIEKITNFEEWYEEQQFEESELSNLLPPRMVLVGLGVDEGAERMVRFVQSDKINISVLTFYAFQHGGETLLARQVEVEHTPVSATRRKGSTTAEKREALNNWLSEHGMKDLFHTILITLQDSLPKAYPLHPNHREVSLNMNMITEKGEQQIRAFCNIRVSAPDEDTIAIKLPRSALPRYGDESLQILNSETELMPQRGGFMIRIDNREHWEQQQGAIVRFFKAAGEAWHQQFEEAKRALRPVHQDAP